MPKFQPDRAVEIVAPKYGTGYRIGGRLVLTCAHLFGDNNDCQVRSKSTFGVTSAKVIWKAPKSIDIALIELPAAIETCSSICFGSLPNSSSAEKVAFDFFGWPRWGFVASKSETRATGLHIEGIIYVADISPDGLLILEVKRSPSILEVEQAILEGKSSWQGTSGAAIVCNGLVVGVQRWHQNPDRPESLEAESLARVYDNQEWCEILEKHDIDPEPKPVVISVPSRSYRNQAPPKPIYFVERPEVSVEVKKLLLSEETAEAGTLVISAIYGLGGIGKSTLAAALAQDKAVHAYFPDGIFWATLGQQPDILSFLLQWIQSLGDYAFKPTGVDAASLQLRTLLADKKALLVVDDLWNAEDVEPFRVAGDGCKLLVTTREAPVKGAIRYDLDIMTETQSLALLTGYLKHKLTLEDQKQAKILANTVGYLPLALELAAAQVEDGISWAELLEDLRAEIANLESLDRLEAEDITNQEKRKHYSLIASFNLSLKRLSPQRLQQFIWLGVLPDDVTITEKMATTLWDCRLTEARKTLRYLRGKALLLTGVSSEQTTSYRVHDLLHDLARNLLQASPYPESIRPLNPPILGDFEPSSPQSWGAKGAIQEVVTEYQLPGLGLSISEAHRQLLSRYQRQTEKALWHSLEDDGYIYNQLIWHLEKAGKIGEIHQLLREETAEGGNGWYSNCEKEGKTATFIKDVSRAWQLAEADFANNPSQSMGLQVRYGLIITSLNSLARNIPPELIAELVKHEIWTSAQGLAYVRLNQDVEKQAEGLRLITPYLTPALFPEALEIARSIANESSRARALTGLAPHLPEILPEVLEVAKGIGDESYRVRALTELAPHLPESLLPKALEIDRRIGDKRLCILALAGLAPHLPESLLPEALKLARAIDDETYRASALAVLAPHLPESLLPEALKLARAIDDETYRASALAVLAPHLPEILPEALEVARGIGDESYRAMALTELAPHLPEILIPEALKLARGIKNESPRVSTLTSLAPYLPESFLPEALKLAREIKNESPRASALTSLAPYLPEVLPEALKLARAIRDGIPRAKALIFLAPYCSESLLSEALAVARGIGDESQRILVLINLAPYCSESLLSEALAVARGIGDESQRILALKKLAPYFPESFLTEALEVARAIGGNGSSRGGELARLFLAQLLIESASHLPKSLLPEALEVARAIRNESDLAKVLTGLAPHLPKNLLPEALEVARAIGNESDLARALGGLAPHLPKNLLPEALTVARWIGDEIQRAGALILLVPHLPEFLPETLTITRGIGDEIQRAGLLILLAPHLPELLPEALKLARGIGDEKSRAGALIWLVPYLPDGLLHEALKVARGIWDVPSRARALTRLAPHLPEVLPEALEVARAIRRERVMGSEYDCAKALTGLAPYLPEVLPEALDIARELWSESYRAEVLTGLAYHLPEVLPEALAVARAIEDEYDSREWALIRLAPLLSEIRPEALEIARSIGNESSRARALTELVPHLPELLSEALETARAIGDGIPRTRALQALTEVLTPANVDQSLWEKTLHALGTLTRPRFLETIPHLAPLIIHFGRIEALREVHQAIREVSRWWK